MSHIKKTSTIALTPCYPQVSCFIPHPTTTRKLINRWSINPNNAKNASSVSLVVTPPLTLLQVLQILIKNHIHELLGMEKHITTTLRPPAYQCYHWSSSSTLIYDTHGPTTLGSSISI